MKAIIIQQTVNKAGVVASVIGMRNYASIAADEITALKQLVAMLEAKNPKWIIRPEYESKNTGDKSLGAVPDLQVHKDGNQQ